MPSPDLARWPSGLTILTFVVLMQMGALEAHADSYKSGFKLGQELSLAELETERKWRGRAIRNLKALDDRESRKSQQAELSDGFHSPSAFFGELTERASTRE